MFAIRFVAAAALIAAAPAFGRHPAPAPAPTSVPEPTDAVLFLLGATGVAVGRWMHARRARQQEADRTAE